MSCRSRAPTGAPEPPATVVTSTSATAPTDATPEPEVRCPKIEGCVGRQVFTANTSYKLVDPERLPADQEPRLRGFIDDYQAICGGLIVHVIGHRGADEPNDASMSRARTVHRALVAGGIPPACTELDDAATTDPIAPEDDPHELNRRVDLQLWHERPRPLASGERPRSPSP